MLSRRGKRAGTDSLLSPSYLDFPLPPPPPIGEGDDSEGALGGAFPPPPPPMIEEPFPPAPLEEDIFPSPPPPLVEEGGPEAPTQVPSQVGWSWRAALGEVGWVTLLCCGEESLLTPDGIGVTREDWDGCSDP